MTGKLEEPGKNNELFLKKLFLSGKRLYYAKQNLSKSGNL